MSSERRRIEIENKRTKLAELRRAREERSKLLAQGGGGSGADSVSISASASASSSFSSPLIWPCFPP